MRRLVVHALILLGVATFLAGCGSPGEPEPTNRASARYFEGTPEEYTALSRACLAEAGFETLPGETADGYLVSTEVANSEEFQAASEACGAELGEIQIEGLSDSQLRERYDARVEQFACLVENDLIEGEPISFEVFVDRYNRSGQKDFWEPTQGASSPPRQGPTDVCPRTTSW